MNRGTFYPGIVNLTPHQINVYTENGEIVIFEKSGHVARLLSAPQIEVDSIKIGISKILVKTPQRFIGIDYDNFKADESTKGVIVSMPIGELFLKNKEMVVSDKKYVKIYGPDTSPEGCVRDERGNIIGTKWLIQYK